MAGLDDQNASPIRITAMLEQGIVMDSFYGLALDGILVSQLRKSIAAELGLGRPGGSDLDGGLSMEHPIDWHLPLARCVSDEASDEWHWACSIGFAAGINGEHLGDEPPDPHRLSVRLDARRAHQVALRVPATAGGSSGRFRPRVTPVLTVVAHSVTWNAVGHIDQVAALLASVPSVGGRRGSGEGAVRQWKFKPVASDDPWRFSHVFDEQHLARPMPAACAKQAGFAEPRLGQAGIRPPLLHPSRQRMLALPVGPTK